MLAVGSVPVVEEGGAPLCAAADGSVSARACATAANITTNATTDTKISRRHPTGKRALPVRAITTLRPGTTAHLRFVHQHAAGTRRYAARHARAIRQRANVFSLVTTRLESDKPPLVPSLRVGETRVCVESTQTLGYSAPQLGSSLHRRLVDAVAREPVELRRQDVARVRRAARRERRGLAVEVDALEASGAPRSPPRRRGRGASAASPRADAPARACRARASTARRAISGQSDASSERHRSVRAHAMSETAVRSKSSASRAIGARQIGPLRRVDDQPVGDRRRAARTRPRRTAAGRASGETPAGRRSGAAARSTPARRARSPRSVSSITSPQIDRSPSGKHRTETSRVEPVGSSSGCGTSSSVRDGCRSAIPASVSSAASATPAAPTRCASSPTCAGSAAPPSLDDASRSRASSRSISAIVTSSPVQSSSVGALSDGATIARPGAAARRTTAAPTCRPRSSGTPAGRAARARRSRRRAPTAPRSRRTRVKSVASPSIASRISRSYASGRPSRNAPP